MRAPFICGTGNRWATDA